jgi:hypothetical protein
MQIRIFRTQLSIYEKIFILKLLNIIIGAFLIIKY